MDAVEIEFAGHAFPSLQRRRGRATKKNAAGILVKGAAGVVIPDHPVCAQLRWLRAIFFPGAATPPLQPLQGGECIRLIRGVLRQRDVPDLTGLLDRTFASSCS